jgi:hypothetical protein
MPAQASILTYKEAASGTEFPMVEKLWLGDEMRCVGAGCRCDAQLVPQSGSLWQHVDLAGVFAAHRIGLAAGQQRCLQSVSLLVHLVSLPLLELPQEQEGCVHRCEGVCCGAVCGGREDGS